MRDRFEWIPGRGPDASALRRLCSAFPRPTTPMGEAWFMSSERKMFDHLLDQDAEKLPFPQFGHALEEIASGTVNLIWLQEWYDWFHYLLPRGILRSHECYAGEYLVESLITAFMSLYPRGTVDVPYSGFHEDILQSLAVCHMKDALWDRGHVRINGMLWRFGEFPREQDCRDICGDFSSLMFFSLKYLTPSEIVEWVPSVFRITCPHWRAQLMLWLIGAHGMLTGVMKQPSEFGSSKHDHLDSGWSWSHILRGDYCARDHYERGVDFIATANLDAFNQGVRKVVTERLFFEWLDCFEQHAHLKNNLFELPERFADIYLSARSRS
jgi:hypothetical protein